MTTKSFRVKVVQLFVVGVAILATTFSIMTLSITNFSITIN